MAHCSRFVCNHCGHAVEAWSDGNPYYLDENGAKQYAYHPDHEGLARCVGNDSPHLCLGCGAEFNVDSRAPISRCVVCGAKEIADVCDLRRRRCPFCRAGEFAVDSGFHLVS